MTPWPVRVAAIGPVSAGATAWRFGGQLMVSAICKASFALVPGAEMRGIEPEALYLADEHDREPPLYGPPGRGPRRASDLAPQLRAVDVTLTGCAYPPAPGATQAMVRLTVGTHAGTLLDKVLYVYGDRDASGALRPFDRVQLNYEHAYGGIGFADNPLGTGYGAMSDKAPNVIDPRQPALTASFAPIPQSFPARKRLLGETDKSALSQRIVEIPADFDWRYYHSAPADQRVSALRGGEWIGLEGMFADRPNMLTRLPLVQALGKVYGGRNAGVPDMLPLIIDTVRIDAEARTCSLVWRGSFPLFDPRALNQLTIALALESEAEPALWPEPEELIEMEPTARVELPRAVPVSDQTIVVSPDEVAAMPIAPFAIAAAQQHDACEWPPRDIPGAPWQKHTAAAREAVAAAKAREEEERQMEAEQRKLEETAAREAEARANRDAAERARAEAEDRRRQEAEKFRAEQEAAERDAARRAAEKVSEQRERAQQLKTSLYGTFKRKS